MSADQLRRGKGVGDMGFSMKVEEPPYTLIDLQSDLDACTTAQVILYGRGVPTTIIRMDFGYVIVECRHDSFWGCLVKATLKATLSIPDDIAALTPAADQIDVDFWRLADFTMEELALIAETFVQTQPQRVSEYRHNGRNDVSPD